MLKLLKNKLVLIKINLYFDKNNFYINNTILYFNNSQLAFCEILIHVFSFLSITLFSRNFLTCISTRRIVNMIHLTMFTYIVPMLYQHLTCWDLWCVLSADGPRDMDHINYHHYGSHKLSPLTSSKSANTKFYMHPSCVVIHVRPVEIQLNTGTSSVLLYMSLHGPKWHAASKVVVETQVLCWNTSCFLSKYKVNLTCYSTSLTCISTELRCN